MPSVGMGSAFRICRLWPAPIKNSAHAPGA